MRRGKSRQRSKSRNCHPENKPSLANLMNCYNPDDSYSIKLNMNYQNPQIIQTKAYQLSSKAKQPSIKCNRKRPISDLITFDDFGPRERYGSNSKYSPSKGSNRVTPPRARPNNLLYLESQYLVSEPGNRNASRQKCGLFRQAIKKESKENSRVINSEYYDLIQKKANEIKQEKKRMLQKCHSNGTLSNVLQTMKIRANDEIDEFARKVLNEKEGSEISETRIQSKIESNISEMVGSNKQNSCSIFNNQFSFQLDNIQLPEHSHHTKTDQTISSDQQSGEFKIGHKQSLKAQPEYLFQPLNLVNRPSSKHQDGASSKALKTLQLVVHNQRMQEPLVSNLSPRVQTPNSHYFKTPKAATVFTKIELKSEQICSQLVAVTPPSHISMVPILRKNSLTNGNCGKWIKFGRPEKVEYLADVLDTTPPRSQLDPLNAHNARNI